MRRWLVVTAVVVQVAVLAGMAAKREMILRHGEVVYLRTAPVDPRDPFRGDYVRLSYPLNSVPLSRLQPGVDRNKLAKGDTVYALLRSAQGDLFELESLSDRRPASGLFLKGSVQYVFRSGQAGFVNVRYGIEQLFVEQGKGVAIELRRGQRNGLQVPMEVEMALGKGGEAQLKGYRWSPLGVQLEVIGEVDGNARGQQGATPRSPVLKLSLHNVSEATMAIVDNSDHCNVHLEAVDELGGLFTAIDNRCQRPVVNAQDMIRLAPGQAHVMTLDLNQARWFVQSLENPSMKGDIASVAGSARFRLVYRTPPVLSGTTGDTALLWRGNLASPAFNARGNID